MKNGHSGAQNQEPTNPCYTQLRLICAKRLAGGDGTVESNVTLRLPSSNHCWTTLGALLNIDCAVTKRDASDDWEKKKYVAPKALQKNSKLQGFATWHWNDQNNVLRFYQDTVPNCIELLAIYTKKCSVSGKPQHLLWHLSNSVLIHLELVWLETKGLVEMSIQESSMTSVDRNIPSK